MPLVKVQSASCSRSYACFIEGWTEHTVQLGGWPSWIDQADGRAGTIVLSSSRPQSFFPEILSNFLLSHFDRRRHWNFTTLKPQELVFSYEVWIYRMKQRRLTKHLELPKSYEESRLSSESSSFRERSFDKL